MGVWNWNEVVFVVTLEEGRELKEHANLTAERENVEMADVGAVEEDGGGGWLPEAVQGPQKGWLSAATGAYDSDDDTLWDIEGDAVEDGNSSIGNSGQISYLEFGFGVVPTIGAAIHLQQVLLPICEMKWNEMKDRGVSQ